MARRPVRIGNFSGYLGDRFAALDEVMAGDPVDVLTADYLAEITLAALAARARKDPARGYVAYVLDQLRPHLPAIAARGIRVVTNAGGLNPAGLAAAAREMIADAGLNLPVAHVEGDDVLDELAASQWEATVPVRVIATARAAEPLRAFGPALGSLYLSSYPGFYHDGGAQRLGEPWPRIDYWPALLPAGLVTQRAVTGDGTVLEVPVPPAAEATVQPVHPEPPAPPPLSPVGDGGRRVPLGTLAHARSGDKGGNANVGIWVRHPAAWEWLRAALSTAAIRDLLPETRDLDIVRHEFPHLRAVHVVLRGLLGTGGSSNLRVDQPGKAVGEYLRARLVPVPGALLAQLQAPGEPGPGP